MSSASANITTTASVLVVEATDEPDQQAAEEEHRRETRADKGEEETASLLDTCVVYCLCACLGLITAFHWIYLAWRWRGQPASRRALGHAVAIWVIQIMFWIFRQSMLPWYVDCKGGERMSVPCLFKEQESRYTLFYAFHIILLAFQLFHW